jgi:hypothetical protein
MTVFLTSAQRYRKVAFKSEAELESAVVAHSREIFGDSRIYVDVKKAIGAKGRTRNIPDGYLIDLSGRTPRLFVVENELAQHDVLRHIAVQILQFSLAFEAEKRLVKKILLDALQAAPEMERVCKQYIALQSLRGLDQLLELLVEDSPFSALVIIDEIPEDLESVLMKKFQFPVELLQISRFENTEGQVAHAFRIAPLSAITHIAPVKNIEPWVPHPCRSSHRGMGGKARCSTSPRQSLRNSPRTHVPEGPDFTQAADSLRRSRSIHLSFPVRPSSRPSSESPSSICGHQMCEP